MKYYPVDIKNLALFTTVPDNFDPEDPQWHTGYLFIPEESDHKVPEQTEVLVGELRFLMQGLIETPGENNELL